MPRASSRDLWTAKLTGQPAPAGTALRARRAEAVWTERTLSNEASRSFVGTVLGIDPSLRGTGLAVVRFETGLEGMLVSSQTLRLQSKLTRPECLAAIARAVTEAIQSHAVDAVAVEETIYVQNDRTAQILGAARGAAIAAAALQHLPVAEYAPKRIKQAVTGRGQASKEQVAAMLVSLLQNTRALPPDESDAAAVAFTHAAMTRG
ncbi:MAG: crossover junction endodeoxyribonuclease RuvC [Opitutales bacterium]